MPAAAHGLSSRCIPRARSSTEHHRLAGCLVGATRPPLKGVPALLGKSGADDPCPGGAVRSVRLRSSPCAFGVTLVRLVLERSDLSSSSLRVSDAVSPLRVRFGVRRLCGRFRWRSVCSGRVRRCGCRFRGSRWRRETLSGRGCWAFGGGRSGRRRVAVGSSAGRG